MIETALSRSKDPIFTFDGVHVASSVDPQREAKSWVSRQSVFRHINQIIVLGIGCGYHLAELETAYPRHDILAVDFLLEAKDFVAKHQSIAVTRSRFAVFNEVEDIFVSELARKAVGAPYTVLAHTSATIYHAEKFAAARDIFCARSLKSFSWVCESRGWFDLFFSKGQLVPIQPQGELLSIKELAATLKTNLAGMEKNVLAVKALRELVK